MSHHSIETPLDSSYARFHRQVSASRFAGLNRHGYDLARQGPVFLSRQGSVFVGEVRVCLLLPFIVRVAVSLRREV